MTPIPTPSPDTWNTLAKSVPELVVFGLFLSAALFFLVRMIMREFVGALKEVTSSYQEGTTKVLDNLVQRIDVLTRQLVEHDEYARMKLQQIENEHINRRKKAT
jgi:hypothetical protein